VDKPTKLTVGVGGAGLVCAAAAVVAPVPFGWLAAWIALACARVALAYRRNRPAVFGKRDGRLSPAAAAAALPYLVAMRIACLLMRTWRRHPPLSQVTPRVWVGGRLRPQDVPAGAAFVVDLTSEFSEPAEIRALPGYRCLPVLDGACPPDDDAFCALLDEIAADGGAAVFHCESGLGRAPTAAALAMVRTGAAPDAASALAQIRRARPMVRPTSVDLEFVRRLEPRLRANLAAGARAAQGAH